MIELSIFNIKSIFFSISIPSSFKVQQLTKQRRRKIPVDRKSDDENYVVGRKAYASRAIATV